MEVMFYICGMLDYNVLDIPYLKHSGVISSQNVLYCDLAVTIGSFYTASSISDFIENKPKAVGNPSRLSMSQLSQNILSKLVWAMSKMTTHDLNSICFGGQNLVTRSQYKYVGIA